VRPYRIPPKLAVITHWPELALACRYSVSQIARHCGVTVPQLRSYCRHQVGWKIKPWLRALRLAEAERALADGQSTAEVAAALGYTDAAHFCGDFKRARRMSPRRWLAWLHWHRTVTGREPVAPPVPLPQARVWPCDQDFDWLGVGEMELEIWREWEGRSSGLNVES